MQWLNGNVATFLRPDPFEPGRSAGLFFHTEVPLYDLYGNVPLDRVRVSNP